jgi:hypothetical protein
MPTAQEVLERARNALTQRNYKFPASRIDTFPHKTLMVFYKYSISVDPQTLTSTRPGANILGLSNPSSIPNAGAGTPTAAITLPVPIRILEPYSVKYDTGNFEALRDFIKSYISRRGQISRSNSDLLDSIGTFAGPLLGMGLNPYTITRLKNVELRKYQLFWKLHPESEEETNTVENIIREIRLRMHPEPDLFGLLLKYPELINFRILGPRNPDHVFPVAPCVIEKFFVDRTAADYPSFFSGTGTPTVYGLYLNLVEIKPLLRNGNELNTLNSSILGI